ncbi:uncharacterized protein [Leptinotarsa decemlineata]|uniref:uncharacterized protein n=1 Tax=Leptinotarsa decemlineata TaxID=7539 RepID=UPI003D305313
MAKYESLGHMNKVNEDETEKYSFYLPHHGVMSEDSVSTKFRVVFDVSASTSSQYSLNDLQMVGPRIQRELISLVLRFREYAYVVCGDIAKMYRQVLIHPEQRSFPKIFWRKSPDNPTSVYELNTVTYCEAASSFLAIRCLFQLATENESAHHSIEEAACLFKDVSSVLKSGCFELRKFHSNDPKVLEYVRDLQHDLNVVDFEINENAKTLGLVWLPHTDMLVFKINIPDNKNATKRKILSCISTIFDPLALLSPVTITSKIIMQKLWLE